MGRVKPRDQLVQVEGELQAAQFARDDAVFRLEAFRLLLRARSQGLNFGHHMALGLLDVPDMYNISYQQLYFGKLALMDRTSIHGIACT